jgi:hypothetical protein
MKKIEKDSVSENLEGIRLFRDDLEEIVQTMHGLDAHIEISDDYNRYDSFDELLQHRGERPLILEMSCRKSEPSRSVSLSFKKNTVSLHSYGGAEAHAMVYELRDYIKRKIPKLYRLSNPFVWWTILWSVVSLTAFMYSGLSSLPTLAYIVKGSVIVLFVVFFGSLGYRRLSFGIFLTKRHTGNVIKRNKDRIILLIIGGLIGIVGTLLIQWIALPK